MLVLPSDMSFIDNEAMEDDVPHGEKEYYLPNELVGGGQTWLNDLMTRLSDEDYISNMDTTGYDKDDGFICDKIIYKKTKKTKKSRSKKLIESDDIDIPIKKSRKKTRIIDSDDEVKP